MGRAFPSNLLTVELDSVPISQAAELVDGTAYIPLRQLLQAKDGWDISWDGTTQTAIAAGTDFTLAFPIGGGGILLDGTAYETHASYLRDGTTYVPLRAAAQLCGLSTAWHGADRPILLSSAALPHTPEDLHWLSRIISAESRGETLLGQLAVGTVVLNRVANPAFPDTVYGVIFDRVDGVQFEPVENGTIHAEPAAQSILAARLCLAGTRVAGESLFFYAPTLSQGEWINANRTYLTTIGCHKFFL